MQQKRINQITEALYTNSASVIKEGILQYATIEQLYELSLYPVERTAFRAAWCLEHVLLNGDKLALINKKDSTLQVYSNSNNWSVLRSISKIVMETLEVVASSIDEKETELLLNKTFDILENTECPIAVRCNCYDILCLLSTNELWIIPELRQRIHFDISINETPALKSRAKRVLKKLERIA
ncbi:hypothetical protein [Sphingobacterium composti Ten et al. 2007 non Yoo et al. 2007]|uniref:hypothetical protein n=1 Tax=Sphingobacterium composti TaxID=363260 RepID=UPI001357E95D|nr:hypothetical protein [Sphingobacterium composti Ten et al. 2007 non Yoo et al. 2007]